MIMRLCSGENSGGAVRQNAVEEKDAYIDAITATGMHAPLELLIPRYWWNYGSLILERLWHVE